ncbi:ciliary neurotrophic factor receptor subunit alpha [Orycteropus afer afer]|uniref:Ciliary neurotrophic factor receptor subunit alpha n=1 Tax=Orycteropus afer afer TaxID=1230840 RepID=A0A8B7AMW7_ORYAF|nr:ciliary neurotrophic factor receptor subunit alpha [Orycteropus afer afer]
MAAPVPWACCAVLAAAAAVVYTQRHSPQEAPHMQYERLGSDVTLPCGTANWDAAVTWRVNGTDLAPDLLNGSQLVLHGLELGHSGLYACFHRDSWHLRHQVLLRVGLPPREPVLSCRSNTYPKGFYCSWHLPTPTYIPNTFNVTVLHGSKIMVCEKDPALKNRCHIRYMHLFSTVKYKVSISVSNALGYNATAITFDEFTIVKPDPPENVVARPVPSNPRRLEVTWQTPSTWPDPESFPLKFFLRYRPLILDQWQHVELSDGTAHTITDAYAGKEYIIQVAAKDNEIGTWSDWSVAAHATPWTEEPRHLTTEAQAPETTTSTTSSLAPPPTTKICDPGELGSGGGPSAPLLVSVPVTLVLAAAATTANSLLICRAPPSPAEHSRAQPNATEPSRASRHCLPSAPELESERASGRTAEEAPPQGEEVPAADRPRQRPPSPSPPVAPRRERPAEAARPRGRAGGGNVALPASRKLPILSRRGASCCPGPSRRRAPG